MTTSAVLIALFMAIKVPSPANCEKLVLGLGDIAGREAFDPRTRNVNFDGELNTISTWAKANCNYIKPVVKKNDMCLTKYNQCLRQAAIKDDSKLGSSCKVALEYCNVNGVWQ